MTRTTDEWIKEYQNKNALWFHKGNPECPHALLTSGNHSNGFFNSRLVIPDEGLLRDAASDLMRMFFLQGGNIAIVHGVVGPQTGATKLAEFISDQVRAYTGDVCFSASPRKDSTNSVKAMIFSDEDLPALDGKSILLCEDVMTTGGSMELTSKAVIDAGGIVLPVCATLVNRSGLSQINGRKILSLIDQHMPIWKPEECPLCKEGSEAIPPKGENWARLNGSCSSLTTHKERSLS